MDRKKQIGIIYSSDKKWIAGCYYIQNLILALNTLPNELKPIINIYTETEADFNLISKVTLYPYLKCNLIKLSNGKSLYRRIFNYLRTRGFMNFAMNSYQIDADDLFLFPGKLRDFSPSTKILYWIPDFQEKYYPNYFAKADLIIRERLINELIKKKIPIVFSSYDSQFDFLKFYPQNHNKQYVLNFAVTHPSIKDLKIEEVHKKYDVEQPYFLCANQFWKHKNHMFLFSAFKDFIDKGYNIDLLCTGFSKDNRNPDYYDQLIHFISENRLEKHIRLLGFIDRKDQLCLMKDSIAIIQPSLFEGWNTTVEDAKALNKYLILSDLKVHREQVRDNVSFFNPTDKKELVNCLVNYKNYSINKIDYSINRQKFAKDFLSIVDNYEKI
jgi:glycosyltransferase involved in cell wall biosynthesis